MHFYRFNGVVRTARHIAAGARTMVGGPLIQRDKAPQGPSGQAHLQAAVPAITRAHWAVRSNLAKHVVSETRRSAWETAWAPRRVPTRYRPAGKPAGASRSRLLTISRKRRRTLLRITAVPICRGRAYPTWAAPREGSGKKRTQSSSWSARTPSALSRANAERPRNRSIRPTAFYGRDGGEN